MLQLYTEAQPWPGRDVHFPLLSFASPCILWSPLFKGHAVLWPSTSLILWPTGFKPAYDVLYLTSSLSGSPGCSQALQQLKEPKTYAGLGKCSHLNMVASQNIRSSVAGVDGEHQGRAPAIGQDQIVEGVAVKGQ